MFSFFKTVRDSDRTDALETLINGSYPRREQALVTMFASGIAVIGLIEDSMPVIIGSMIIAPMLMPVLSLGMSIAIRSPKLLVKGAKAVFNASLASFIFGILLAFIIGYDQPDTSTAYLHTIEPSLTNALVAIFAGLVSSFAIAKKSLNSSMSGVAIAVALIPPLAAGCIFLADGDWQGAKFAFATYGMNVILISAVAAGVFTYLSFGTDKRGGEKAIKAEEKEAKKETSEADKQAS